jgi:hypothetical protein
VSNQILFAGQSYRNFIETIHSRFTRTTYKNSLSLYLRHRGVNEDVKVVDTLLEKERLDSNNHMSNDKDTIGKDRIIEELYNSGCCSRLQALNLIHDALRSKKLIMVATDTYKKIG